MRERTALSMMVPRLLEGRREHGARMFKSRRARDAGGMVLGALLGGALLAGPSACGHDPYTPGPVCQPAETIPCYSGPAGTEGTGACKAGVRKCNTDLEGFGACLYEVTPVAETCATPEDDDCDGEVNEEGEDCQCAPGAEEPCYSGAPATEGKGPCTGGTRTCEGGFWGACEGEVVPAKDDCTNLADEDCDGVACAAPQWGLLAGGAGDQIAFAVAVDAEGNTIVAGSFTGSLDFGDGPLDALPGGSDAFVVKLGAAGAPAWSRRFGGMAASEAVTAVAVDSGGDVLVAGWFEGALDVDGVVLTNEGGRDAFLAKLDGATGQSAWAAKWGLDGDQEPTALALATSGDVLLAGAFTGTLTCLGGMCGFGSVVSEGGTDAFVIALSPTGAEKWVRTLGGTGQDAARALTLDASGNVVVVGDFSGALQIGDDSLTTTGPTDTDLFVATLASGDLAPIEGREFGDKGTQIAASAAWADGALFVTGWTDGILNWGFATTGDGTGEQAFVARLGDSAQTSWARGFPAVLARPVSLAVKPGAHLAITGFFNGEIDFGTGPLLDPAASNAFLVRLDLQGQAAWAKAFGGTRQGANDLGAAVAVAPGGDVVFAGTARSAFDFGLGDVPNAGGYDVAVARFAP